MGYNNFLIKIRVGVTFLYKFVMPSLTIILLLGVSSIIARPMLGGSIFIDTAIRIVLCLWFCTGYVSLPNLSEKYKPYPNIKWKKSDVSLLARLYYSFLALLFGSGIVVVTQFVISVFLPIFKDISLILALTNGIIYAIPLIMQYEIFKH